MNVNMEFVEDFTVVLEEAKQVIKDCFEKYTLDEVFLSFNGGKDCTVLLDIVINVLRETYKATDVCKKLKVVYIRTKNPFNEIEEFVDIVKKHYALNLATVEGDMKSTLERILKEDGRLKACLMGTRRADPHGAHLNFMQETDKDWPSVMRVSPLLNWSYHQIWSYVRHHNVPYCSLYDRGYTSIGSTLNTWPNPALSVEHTDGSGRVLLSYLPAWRLQNGGQERAGRNLNAKNVQNGHSSNDQCVCVKLNGYLQSECTHAASHSKIKNLL